MSCRRPLIASLALAALAIVSAGSATAQPRVTHGRLTSQAAGSPLASGFRTLVAAQPDVAWIGYSVPVVANERVMCCGDSGSDTSYVSGSAGCCRACRLEPSSSGSTPTQGSQAAASGPIKLEGTDRLIVLFRVSERAVERIRVFSEDCELDAGGRAVVWLDGVRPAESVALLESYAVGPADGTRKSTLDGAVTAIALHGDASADASLERLVASQQPEAVRRKVTFWLGNARGARGLGLLQRVLRDDPSIEVRKSAVFGVSQSREPGAFDALAALSSADKEPRIRSEAMFWLAQKGNPRAAAVILKALDSDPSAEVRKKAVFALSQLKADEGVTALITLARTHADAAVRSESIFWLGQKAGARAASAITDRIENDADTEVKKRAVFALSQLPAAEGVPLLVTVARTNANMAVRKQAMFWLGQSKDARAVAFFEEVLTRR